MNKLYRKSPVFLHNIACSYYGYKIKKQRFRNFFQKKLEWLEKIQWWTKSEIENVLNCKVTDQYGFAEGCGNASRCENDLFHEDFESGILEYLNEGNFDKSKKNEE